MSLWDKPSPEYDPDAVKKLDETMGRTERPERHIKERGGVYGKTKDAGKEALERIKEELKKQ